MCSSEAGYMETRVVAVGQRRPLQQEDLSPLTEEDSVQHVCSTFEQHWRTQEEATGKEEAAVRLEAEEPLFPGEEPLFPGEETLFPGEETLFPGEEPVFPGSIRPGFSLLHALWMTFSQCLLQVGLLRMLTDLLELLGPLALRWIILFIENQAVFDWQGRTYVLVLVGVVACHSLVEQLHEKHSRTTRAKAQVALTAMLYRKVLFVSRRSHCQVMAAGLTTHLSADVEKVAGLVVTLPLLLALPLRVALCLGFLWQELGPSALVGVTVLLFLIPVNSAVRRRVKLLKRSQMKAREERGTLLKEMLTEIKMLKQLAWESWFQYRVTAARERELETLSVLSYLTAFSLLGHMCVPFLVCVSSLGVFVLMDDGNVLTPSQVFTSIWLFRLLRPTLFHLPNLSPTLTQAKCSLCRLESVFRSENTDLDCCHSAFIADEIDLDAASCSLAEALQRNNQGDSGQLSGIKAEVDHQSPSASGADIRWYLQTFGCGWVLLCLLTQLGLVLVAVGQDGLLGVWTSDAKEVQGLEGWTELRDSRLSLYVLLGLLQAILVCAAAHFLTQGSLRASGGLHGELLSSVLHLPLSFFHNTPPERVLQSFTWDVYVIDEQLPKHLRAWAHSQLEMCAAVFLLSLVTPVFLLAAAPLLILLFSLQSQYTPVLRRMEHLEMASRLSVKALFQEMPHGDHGDRDAEAKPAALYEDHSLSHCHRALHDYLVCHFNRIIMGRWVSLRLDAVLSVLVFLVTLILLESADSVDSGIVGLALLYALSMRGVFYQWRRASSDVQDSMRAVRKMSEYSTLEKEGPWMLPHRVPPGWPQWGEIELRNLEARSLDGHFPAFRGVTFHIQRGEKVGVLSRERADTEALVSCLLRTLEGVSGTLLIDGVDVTSLGLQDLRRRINVIPQVPVLFSGTLRANLDPGGRLPDAQVWLALELCHLKDTVQALPGKLLHPVWGGDSAGCSLSEGQRRLLCVARALLWRSSVLLVEEPLAPVELQTESLVQQLIHTEFSSCTVLTMTQNPDAVTGSHRVLVLDAGRVLDFDTPSNVYQRNALFAVRPQRDAPAAAHGQRRF